MSTIETAKTPQTAQQSGLLLSAMACVMPSTRKTAKERRHEYD
ncbi:hypothetical protein [Klebsiella oxytoca]